MGNGNAIVTPPRIKVNRHVEPCRTDAEPTLAAKPRMNFRDRYAALEARRADFVARLTAFDETRRRHPGYKRARKLLNDSFRKGKLPQRLAVLQAAAWLIDVLEKLATLA